MLATPRRANGGCEADVLTLAGRVIASMLTVATWCAHTLRCLLTCSPWPMDAVIDRQHPHQLVQIHRCKLGVNDALQC
jgi:hypothetical protein